jgi:NAD(P)-dependent dehydrogenase (short-subunit alcohol dehydrogenase family)
MKKAVITGCADGIGFSIAQELINNGYEVYGFDIKNQRESQKMSFYLLDINDDAKLFDFVSHLPNIDLLVNNAARQIEKPFKDNTLDEIDAVLNTNLNALIKLTNLMLNKLNEESVIINIGSIHSELPRLNKLTYDVSKAGLDMFTKGLALELSPKTRVIGLNIGATMTPMNESFKNESIMTHAESKVPMKHIFLPQEIAQVVSQLLAPTFKYMTGVIIVYDGGRSLM